MNNTNQKRIALLVLVVGSVAATMLLNQVVFAETNDVIKEGLDNCSKLQTVECVGVMHTLNNICQDSFFESCFGDKWELFMKHLSEEYEHQGLDSFVTINNEHFGNDTTN